MDGKRRSMSASSPKADSAGALPDACVPRQGEEWEHFHDWPSVAYARIDTDRVFTFSLT
jgi:hypothetical protein